VKKRGKMLQKWITTSILVSGLLLACAPEYPKCDDDADCRDSEYCVNGICQQCRTDIDCDPGYRCSDGACEAIEGYCTTDDECPEMNVCQNNVCIEVQCVSDSDCGPGEVCRSNNCSPAAASSPAPLVGAGGCTLDTVYFEFDSSILEPAARRKLKSNAECIKSMNETVVIEGHCDPRGTTEYNLALGDRRARSTKRYLKQLGVNTTLRALSKGEEEATGRDEEGWARDRRAEFQ